ncbi:hypothetical protein, partial [Aerococcus mictus]|uniref:hypothetical protein n=1 Tax=Aerococcus mictus TaxID=2976810 RepID=UPI001C65E711
YILILKKAALGCPNLHEPMILDIRQYFLYDKAIYIVTRMISFIRVFKIHGRLRRSDVFTSL